MSLHRRLASLWRNLVHRQRVEQELDAELQGYVAMLTDENGRGGMSADDARRAAIIEAGGIAQVKEDVRDVRSGTLLETMAQDIRYGARMLAKSPGFALAAVVALALGIGATTAILSVVDAVLLRPLPYDNADRLVVILHHGTDPVASGNYIDWRDQSRSFAAMSAADYWTPNLTGADKSEKLWGLKLTTDLLPMLGVRPLMGRLFATDEGDAGRDHEAVLGYGLWQRRFAGDPAILGKEIKLDGEAYTVIGVMPSTFNFAPFWATKAELWVPMSLAAHATERGGNHLRVFARLAPGVSLAQARADIAAITTRLRQEYPGTNGDVRVVPLKDRVVGDVRPALLVLLGAVGFVLLIACANVAHMLLARAAARQREIAVRTALGASRARIVRQLLTESLLLGGLGGTAGLALAACGIRVLVALGPRSIPRVDTIALDGRVLFFTLVVSLVTGVGFGLVPALQASVLNLSESFKEGGGAGTEGVKRHRLRSMLMASELALALVLLVGAGLMIRTFVALQQIDPGFDPRGVLSMTVSVAGSAEAAPGRRVAFYKQVLEKVRAIRGVHSASLINHLPLAGDMWGWSYWIEGQPLPAPGETPTAVYRVVMPGYFKTMGIALQHGRDVQESDAMGAPRVLVINERLAQRAWPGKDAIGQRMSIKKPTNDSVWMTVVGVTKNARQEDWASAPQDEMYIPVLQSSSHLTDPDAHVAYLTLVVRAGDDPAALAPAVREAIWSIDRGVAVSEVHTMPQVVADATAGPWFYLLLLVVFACVALVLAAVGIFGVMSYAVTRRTHEIGIRVALGAKHGDVVRLVVGQGMRVALAGAGVGIVGALILTRLMSGLLYGVRSTDPVTFIAVTAILCAVALAATLIPARRAARIDPIQAMRSE
ncbi:MAG: ABC transporter permease, partial [Gemmatimonadota bacterium]|nr:ABC transporter permease [Gemmatimonadota bacterium]